MIRYQTQLLLYAVMVGTACFGQQADALDAEERAAGEIGKLAVDVEQERPRSSVEPATYEQPGPVLNAPVQPRSGEPKGAVSPATNGNHQDAPSAPSDAEKISRLERSIDADQKRLAELKFILMDPESEYAKAEADFKQLDTQVDSKKKELQKLKESGNQEDSAKLQADLDELEKKWSRAKDRFQLSIQERKAHQENLATLEQKIQKDHGALDKIKGTAQSKLAPDPTTAIVPVPQTAPATPEGSPPAAMPANAPPAATATSTELAPPAPAALSPPAILSNAAAQASVAANPIAAPAPQKAASKALVAATEEANKSEAAAQAAEEIAHSISERMEILRKNVELERKLRDMARKKVDHADETLKSLNEELQRKLGAGEPIGDLRQQINDAVQRLHDAQSESRRLATHLDDLQTELGKLQSEEIAALKEAGEKRHEAETAQRKVADLKNPFTLRNFLQWLLDHGLNIVAILIAMSVFVWLSRIFEARLIDLISTRGRRGSREERENRAKTLVSVFRNAANILAVGGGMVMVLDELSVPIGPLLGGAAVIGLAVAFGAQSLIKDYFTGFMVLLEQQYMINDVIKIGDIAGQVERITLRMTVLRDLEGRVHFVPHGQITTLTNLTHGWSRAVFEMRIAYQEDVDRVIQVLMELARELRNDEKFGRLILEDPTMLGVDSFGDSSVVIKFLIKTRPLQQWNVKRELLRRIKNKFDELGIEIPFPHRTIYHRDAPPLAATERAGPARWSDEEAA